MKKNVVESSDLNHIEKELLLALGERFSLYMKHAMGQLRETHKLRAIRGTIARLRQKLCDARKLAR